VTRQDKAAAKRLRRALKLGASSYARNNGMGQIARAATPSAWRWPSNPHHKDSQVAQGSAKPSRRARLMAALKRLVDRHGKGAR
jgi:hypothetical protein